VLPTPRAGAAARVTCAPAAALTARPPSRRGAQECKVAVTPRSICLVVQKASPGPYWGKLLKAPGKPPHNVRVDWSKFKDEDEEAEGAGARPRAPPARPAAPFS
jgi:hypothetical protein